MRVGGGTREIRERIEDRNAAAFEASLQIAEEIAGDEIIGCSVAMEEVHDYDVVAPSTIPELLPPV